MLRLASASLSRPCKRLKISIYRVKLFFDQPESAGHVHFLASSKVRHFFFFNKSVCIYIHFKKRQEKSLLLITLSVWPTFRSITVCRWRRKTEALCCLWSHCGLSGPLLWARWGQGTVWDAAATGLLGSKGTVVPRKAG